MLILFTQKAKNDICYLTLDSPDSETDNAYFWFHVLVVRTGKMQLDHAQFEFELGLKILSAPIYFSLHDDHQQELSLLDKTHIMYKYYDLNKKAYEIITNTPDVRTEKINKIKKFIEKGSYNVGSEKIAQSVINDIFMEEILLAK